MHLIWITHLMSCWSSWHMRFKHLCPAHTTDFLLQAALRKNQTDFFSDQKSAHKDRFFLLELLCVKIAGEVSLLDDVTPIFYRTEVSAHGPILCRKQLREKIGAILYRSKSQRIRTDSHTDFCLREKNGPCALGINPQEGTGVQWAWWQKPICMISWNF